MKRLSALLIVACLAFALFAGCADRTQTPNNNNGTNGTNGNDNNGKDNDNDKNNGGDKTPSPQTKHYVPTYSTYDTFDKMYDDADAVIRGKVDRATPDTNDDYIYLSYDIKASDIYAGDLKKDDIITIRQTKTSPDSKLTDKVGVNSPLLSEGNEYVLFLKKVAKGDGYDEHYIIVGEDQGYAEVTDGGMRLRTTSSLMKDDYESLSDLETKVKSRVTTKTR